MAKRTENQDNLKKFQQRLKELDGQLVPSPSLPPEALMSHLAKEGHILLATEAKAAPLKPSPQKDESKRLSNTLASTSKNPYIRARAQILSGWANNPRTAWRAKEIESMEAGRIPKDRHYDEFVKEVAELGDKLSNPKK